MNNHRLVAFAPALIAIALAATGCSSSSSSQSNAQASTAPVAAAAIIDACDLMTLEVAKKFLGSTAHQTMKARPNKHMTHCAYASDNGSISVMVGDDWSDINDGQENVPGEKPLSGLGDEAHINPSSLRVRKGTRGMDITVIADGGEFWGKAADAELSKNETASVAVARALVPNL